MNPSPQSLRTAFPAALLVALFVLLLPLLAACGGGKAAAAEPTPVAAQPAAEPVVQPVIARPTHVAAKAGPAAVRTLPDRLELPSIEVDIPVVELGWSQKTNQAGQVFSEWDVANFAAGWHKNSALPGEGENIVLSGHNNIKGAVFRELDQLKRGDPIVLYSGNVPHEYLIDQVLIVPEKHASAEQRKLNAAYIESMGEERLTLVSCWPRDDNTHRIIVIAHPASTATVAQ